MCMGGGKAQDLTQVLTHTQSHTHTHPHTINLQNIGLYNSNNFFSEPLESELLAWLHFQVPRWPPAHLGTNHTDWRRDNNNKNEHSIESFSSDCILFNMKAGTYGVSICLFFYRIMGMLDLVNFYTFIMKSCQRVQKHTGSWTPYTNLVFQAPHRAPHILLHLFKTKHTFVLFIKAPVCFCIRTYFFLNDHNRYWCPKHLLIWLFIFKVSNQIYIYILGGILLAQEMTKSGDHPWPFRTFSGLLFTIPLGPLKLAAWALWDRKLMQLWGSH